MIGSAGYYGAYLFILLKTISGDLSIGDLTFLAGSFRQLRSLLEGILNRFTTISQSAVVPR
jgi:ATP-binding cassette subfamily B protein